VLTAQRLAPPPAQLLLRPAEARGENAQRCLGASRFSGPMEVGVPQVIGRMPASLDRLVVVFSRRKAAAKDLRDGGNVSQADGCSERACQGAGRYASRPKVPEGKGNAEV
jgi:hypothetical protein